MPRVFPCVVSWLGRWIYRTNRRAQQVLTLDFCSTCDPAGIVMTSNGQPWVHDQGNIQVPNPVCTEFNPGIFELNQKVDCDCNGNQSRDEQYPAEPGAESWLPIAGDLGGS